MTKRRQEILTNLFNDLVRECRMSGNTEAERMLTKLYESIESQLQHVDNVRSILDQLHTLGVEAEQYL